MLILHASKCHLFISCIAFEGSDAALGFVTLRVVLLAMCVKVNELPALTSLSVMLQVAELLWLHKMRLTRQQAGMTAQHH